MTIIEITINATIPKRMYFPASGGGACLSVAALYKIKLSCGLVN
jgi:hypothetical protein